MRQSYQRDLQGNRDLLFHFFGSMAREQSHHRDLNISHVGEGFDRQSLEREHAYPDEEDENQKQEQRLVDREVNNLSEHRLECGFQVNGTLRDHPITALRPLMTAYPPS